MNDSFYKKQTEKIELAARPALSLQFSCKGCGRCRQGALGCRLSGETNIRLQVCQSCGGLPTKNIYCVECPFISTHIDKSNFSHLKVIFRNLRSKNESEKRAIMEKFEIKLLYYYLETFT